MLSRAENAIDPTVTRTVRSFVNMYSHLSITCVSVSNRLKLRATAVVGAILVVCLAAALAVWAAKPASAVSGGNQEDNVVPWAAALVFPDTQYFVQTNLTGCSGVLVDREHVLTAAHCGSPSKVVLGRPDLKDKSRGIERRVLAREEPIFYNRTDLQWDIQVLTIESVPSEWPVLPLLPHSVSLQNGSHLDLYGYGRVRDGGNFRYDQALRLLSTPTGSFEYRGTCGTTVQLACIAGVDSGVDVLNGDSGAPWVWRDSFGTAMLAAVHAGDPAGFPHSFEAGARIADPQLKQWILGRTSIEEFQAGTVVRHSSTGRAWLVGSDGFRYWIQNDDVLDCLANTGASVLERPFSAISQTPEKFLHVATCDSSGSSTAPAPPPPQPTMSITSQWRGASDGYHPGNTIRFTSTVSRPEVTGLQMKTLSLVVRDPDNLNVDRVCGRNITVAAGGSHDCDIRTVFLKPGTYSYWYAYEGVDGSWHRLSDTQPFSLSHRSGHMGASEIWVGGPDGMHVGNQINFSALVTRGDSPWNGNAAPMGVIVRDPDGHNVDVFCAETVTVQKNGGRHRCNAGRTFWKPGTYTYHFAWRGASGSQPWHRLSADRTFTLTNRDGFMGASKIWTGAPDGWHTGNEIQFSSLVTRGQSPWNGNAAPMAVIIRGPGDTNYDLNCRSEVTVPKNGGQVWCQGKRVFKDAGTYTYWYAWKSASGGIWYRLSEERTFTLSHRSGFQGASDISVTAPNGMGVGQPINFSALVTRANSPWSGNADPMVVAIRGPQGQNLDHACAPTVTVPSGDTYRCEVTAEFTQSGEYSYFFSWRGASGDQPWYRMSEDRTFTIG